MNRKPPPSSQVSWKMRSRSSAETLNVSIVLSSKPMATLELRTWSQVALEVVAVGLQLLPGVSARLPAGTLYCGVRWNDGQVRRRSGRWR